MLQAAEVLARVGADVILDCGLRERVRDAFAAQPNAARSGPAQGSKKKARSLRARHSGPESLAKILIRLAAG